MIKEHQLHDKTFQPFISEVEIQANVQKLALSLEKDYEGKELLFIAILNGAFMFASDLMKNFKQDVAISFVKVSSYHGTQTTGRVDELIGLNTSLHGKHVVILEDIVDTGITIDKVITLLNSNYPESVEVCTLLYKPEAYKGKHKPKYIGFEIPNKFVVGYGLDYNELGRNLKELYQLKEE
jgi:hypoxanthine phosphoribosyltransferase